eukprot:COSAG02_NODE_343_length_24147_cov_30.662051_4_plen_176_part_00
MDADEERGAGVYAAARGASEHTVQLLVPRPRRGETRRDEALAKASAVSYAASHLRNGCVLCLRAAEQQSVPRGAGRHRRGWQGARHSTAHEQLRTRPLTEALTFGTCPQGVVQEGAIVRGDLAKMVLGKYCTIGKNVVMHPVFYPRAQGCAAFLSPRRPAFRTAQQLTPLETSLV